MKQRKLGTTDVSAIGYGAMSFSDFYGPTDDERSHAILKKCLDLGVTHIDTSNVYGGGLSEKRIGSFLARQGNQAQDMFKIATKAGIATKSDGTRYYNNTLEHLKAELDKSLDRLGVDQVELFYVHRRDSATPIEEITESLATLVNSGKARQVGYSEIAPTTLALAQDVHPIGAVQSEYSLWTRSPELGLVQRCQSLGTSLVAFSPVGRSMLTDHPLSAEVANELPFLKINPRFQEPNYSRNLTASNGFRALSREMGLPAAGLAIAWLLAQGNHVLPIPGTRSVAHFDEVCAGADFELSESDLSAIETVLPVGWSHGDRYGPAQWLGPERYC